MEYYAQFVGTCLDSFDEEGLCINPYLPWEGLLTLAKAGVTGETLAAQVFQAQVTVPPEIADTVAPHATSYWRSLDGVWIIYDRWTDRHYFFV